MLKIYSIVRFLITTFLLGALAWYGFMTLEKYQTRYLDYLTPVEELVRTIKDSQISLEKYRQFGQLVQLEDVAKNLGLAENRLNNFSQSALFRATPGKPPVKLSSIDSLNQSIKAQKEIIDTLKVIHQEEDLSPISISGIGNLRIELEKAVIFAVALRKPTLAEIGVQSGKVLSQLKFNLLIVLGLALILYLIEIIWLFRALRIRKTVSKVTVESTPPISEDSTQINQPSSEPQIGEVENPPLSAEALGGGEPQTTETVAPAVQAVSNSEENPAVEVTAKESLIEPIVKPEPEINIGDNQKPEPVEIEPKDVSSAPVLPETAVPPAVEPTPEVQSTPLIDIVRLQLNFRKIEETVDDINERISLMAFNALLEAARAGDAGKGFQVIAEELRRLADRSAKSAGDVKKLLEETLNKLSNVNPA